MEIKYSIDRSGNKNVLFSNNRKYATLIFDNSDNSKDVVLSLSDRNIEDGDSAASVNDFNTLDLFDNIFKFLE